MTLNISLTNWRRIIKLRQRLTKAPIQEAPVTRGFLFLAQGDFERYAADDCYKQLLQTAATSYPKTANYKNLNTKGDNL